MGSITNSLNGLSYLTQPGGLLSSLPAPISTAALQSASPQDVVSLSVAALQKQEVDGILAFLKLPRTRCRCCPSSLPRQLRRLMCFQVSQPPT